MCTQANEENRIQKAGPWFTSSPHEDAFRPARLPGIVRQAPSWGQKDICPDCWAARPTVTELASQRGA